MPPVHRSPRRLVVSVHDVSPATARAARSWAAMLDRLGIPLSLLVVPGPWRGATLGEDGPVQRDLAAWLRSRREAGDEVSLHGWCHRADVPGSLPRRLVGAVVARGAAEMWGVAGSVALERTRTGLRVLERLDLHPVGTTPPGWLSSAAARRAFAEAGLQYVTDHAGLVDLTTGRRWRAPALCHRPAALGGAPTAGTFDRLLEGVGRGVVGQAGRIVAAGGSVRIALHPDDLLRPGLAEATVRAVEGALTAGARPTTYAAVLEGMRQPA